MFSGANAPLQLCISIIPVSTGQVLRCLIWYRGQEYTVWAESRCIQAMAYVEGTWQQWIWEPHQQCYGCFTVGQPCIVCHCTNECCNVLKLALMIEYQNVVNIIKVILLQPFLSVLTWETWWVSTGLVTSERDIPQYLSDSWVIWQGCFNFICSTKWDEMIINDK